ncbi:TPR-like protein [Peniophora sp. CONT]|nr:TPR-like protein [Peniophora sp. CONT]
MEEPLDDSCHDVSVETRVNVPQSPLGTLKHGISSRLPPSRSPAEISDAMSSHVAQPSAQSSKKLEFNDLAMSGSALLKNYSRSRTLDDLEGAITVYQYAVGLTPDHYPDKPYWYTRLGFCLYLLFRRIGNLGNLQSSIVAFRSAIELTPNADHELPRRLNNLAISLRTRFNRLGELKDLESALETVRRAVELTPGDDPELPPRLSSLANSLRTRFNRLGELTDLENALQAVGQAVELTPRDDPELPLRLSNLAVSLWTRFNRLGGIQDLEIALETDRRAVLLTPGDDPELPLRLSNLAISLRTRFNRLGELKDLESALETDHRAVELTPGDDPELPLRLSNLAISLRTRFNRLGELKDLESALETDRRAVELTPGDDPDLPRRLSNFAVSLRARFNRLGELKDLESALETHRQAVDLTPSDDPEFQRQLSHLADTWRTRFYYDRTQQSFDASIECYMTATTQPLGEPLTRFNCANACVRLLSDHPEFSSSESLLLAYSRILDALPELVWLGHSVQRRFEESVRVGKLVNAAVCAAIEVGDHPRALEWLEAGRGLVWSQVASMRTHIDDLAECLPDLARKLGEVQQELRLSGFSGNLHRSRNVIALDERDSVSGLQTESTPDRHRKATILYDDLVKDIRSHDGFEDFMRPRKLSNFTSSPAFAFLNGSVVFLNAGKVCYDALILSCTGAVTSVKLPRLTQKRAEKLRSLWTQHVGLCRAHRRGLVTQERIMRGSTNLYGRMLGCLWTWCIQPILQGLGFTEKASDTDLLPHITWCPTGPLTQLPLHAAGIYDVRGSGPRVYDFVVSSYTPSLSALLRCYEGSGKLHPSPSMLLVAQPDTPRKGLSWLPHVRTEAARIRTLLPGDTHTVLNSEKATVEAVLDVLDQHAWVHLACHGSQNREDPTESAFELYDNGLTLSALMSKASTNAELAFLSACETAAGDPKIPEESAHLAAGMLAVGFKGVVATMWSIWDKDGPVIVEAYYARLLELRGSGTLKKGETGAAYALHDAVKCLREEVGENNFERWVPFVHFGA